MRVTGIYNGISLSTPLKSEKQKECMSYSSNTDIQSGNNYSALNHLSFLGKIVYLSNYNKHKADNLTNQPDGSADFFAMQYFLNFPVDKDVPKNLVSILNSAYMIQNNSISVLDRFDDVYDNALSVICDVRKNLLSERSSWRCFKVDNQLVELDKKGRVLRETVFRDNSPKIIKDYENSSIIFIEPSRNNVNISDFTVYLKCKNMDNPECIKARESFSFKEGEPHRHCVAVEKDINSDRFIANRVYTYENNILSGYDSHLTIAGGAEYSNEYYEFSPKLNQDYLLAPGEYSSVPSRFVTNKIVTNGYLIHSNEEILLSRYIKDYAGL